MWVCYHTYIHTAFFTYQHFKYPVHYSCSYWHFVGTELFNISVWCCFPFVGFSSLSMVFVNIHSFYIQHFKAYLFLYRWLVPQSVCLSVVRPLFIVDRSADGLSIRQADWVIVTKEKLDLEKFISCICVVYLYSLKP